MSNIKTCFIPAAGFGKRMKELTVDLPKPLLKVDGFTLLKTAVSRAKLFAAERFVINAHYHSEKIAQEISLYRNTETSVSEEKGEILGTAGGIRTAVHRGFIKENEKIMIVNPDMLYFPDHSEWKPEADSESVCTLFLGKKNPEDSFTGFAFRDERNIHTHPDGQFFYIGICILDVSVLNYLEPDKYADLSEDFKRLAVQGKLFGKIFPGKFYDTGEKEKYEYLKNAGLVRQDNELVNMLESF